LPKHADDRILFWIPNCCMAVRLRTTSAPACGLMTPAMEPSVGIFVRYRRDVRLVERDGDPGGQLAAVRCARANPGTGRASCKASTRRPFRTKSVSKHGHGEAGVAPLRYCKYRRLIKYKRHNDATLLIVGVTFAGADRAIRLHTRRGRMDLWYRETKTASSAW